MKFRTSSFRPAWNEGLRAVGLRTFKREGMAAAAQYSMTSVFLSAFALALGADSIYIGLLSAVPVALWTVALLPSAIFCQNNIQKRKWIVVASATAARLMWIPIILIALWFAASNLALGALLLVVTISTAVGALSTPAWASIAGDLVPEGSRGRYFSKRTIATTAAGLAASLAAGWILDVFGKNDPLGFAVIFAIGLGFGLLSSLLFSTIPIPPTTASKDFHGAAIRDVFRDRRFRTFLLLFGIWEFGIMFSAPFQNVFILKTLGAEYIWLAILVVASGVAGILVQRGWGVFSDRYGHRVVMIIAAFGTVPALLLWLPATSAWMLLPVEIFSGMVWAGFALANYNYMLETSPSRARPVYSAMFNVVIGITGVIAPIAGGLIATYFTTHTFLGFSEFRVLFLVTCVFRFVSGILFMLFLREIVEKRERVAPGYVFGEMLKYGVQGGIFRAHHAAGGLASDASALERGLKSAARIVGKDIRATARAVEGAVERVMAEADKKGDKIAEGDRPAEQKNKKKVGDRLRVKVSE